MHTYVIQKGTINVSIELEIIDSTAGTPETGVVWNTAGIALEYRRDAAASTAITEATLAALTTAHTDGGFLHIGNGVYRFDLPDAACATGVDKVVIHGTVTGMVVIPCVIQLVDYDPFDAVRMGMTALPNAAANAAGGLAISVAGGLDLDGRLDAAITSRLAPTTAGRTLDVSANGNAGIDYNNLEGVTATNNFTNTTIGTTTANTDMRGTDNALLAASINLTGGAVDTVTDVTNLHASAATAADLLDKLGAVSEAAAAGDPSATESVMQYVKQIVNILTGTTGITTMPAAAAPANNVSLAEMIRAIYDDSNELQGDWVNGGRLDLLLDAIPTTAMRGTDNAATAAAQTTAQNDLDILTGTDGAALATSQPNYAPNTVVPDAAGVAPTAAEITADIDANSTQLTAILVDTASMGIVKNATFSNLEFLMVDATDFATPEAGLTVTGQMSIDGAAFAAVNGAIAEVGSGIYQIDLTAADTNGDVITYKFASAGAADRFVTIKTRA